MVQKPDSPFISFVTDFCLPGPYMCDRSKEGGEERGRMMECGKWNLGNSDSPLTHWCLLSNRDKKTAHDSTGQQFGSWSL